MNEPELQIILAEYSRQQQRMQSSIDTVNQTLNIYLGVIAIILPVAAGTVVWTQQEHLIQPLLGMFAIVAGVASFFTFIRSFQARIEQTNAERALSRLRNYFVANYSDTRIYLSDAFYDDWPTPYTHRWHSASFFGWLALILITSMFAGLSVYFIIVSANQVLQQWFLGLISLSVGVVTFGICYFWLDSRLKGWRLADKKTQRFPYQSQVQPQSSGTEIDRKENQNG